MTVSRFSETETEAFYDAEDGLYRSFWDSEGSLHWGYFHDLKAQTATDFIPACQRWNEYMLESSGITASSKVLDVGCGNGNTAIWLAQKTGCEVIGVDLSAVRVNNAIAKAEAFPDLRVQFQKASATQLPFDEGTFTHVWSQATLYHVHQRAAALAEIYRVLKNRGIFLFDDLTTPQKPISAKARQYTYDRLLFEPTDSHDEYIDRLCQLGLMVVQSKDLTQHLHKSYELLSQLAQAQYPDLSAAYDRMGEVIGMGELGWSFFEGEKVSDRLSWIYETSNTETLEARYNAWSRIYDTELDQPYRISPIRSASALTKVVPDHAAAILDAGAGTGMIGESLAELGYSNITAIDLSADMLEVARQKGVYQTLDIANLDQPIQLFPPESFEAIVAVGVFTFGHASPSGLLNLDVLLKRGGYFVLTVRMDYYETNTELKTVLDQLSWVLVNQEQFNIFDTEKMSCLTFQKS